MHLLLFGIGMQEVIVIALIVLLLSRLTIKTTTSRLVKSETFR